MQLVACFCLHTGGLLHWVSSKLTAHESPLLRQILPLLPAGTLLLADRGFASYSNLGLSQERQIDAVMRLHQARKVDLRRWQAELYLRDIKTTMGMEQLRCKSPAMVHIELLFFVIAYNLLRLLMVEAAILSDQQPQQIPIPAHCWNLSPALG